MESSTIYPGFAVEADQEIEQLREELLKVVIPQKLYLLGLISRQTRTESLFALHGASRKCISHYYLLVLTQNTKEQSLHAIQDKIENNLQHFIPVTAIVLAVEEFIQWLLLGNPFACTVKENACLLYESPDCILPDAIPVNEAQLEKEKESLFMQTRLKAEGFLAGAELYRIRKEYKLSAFMLHQAAEQVLRAMLIINTGLKINTHSIDKLIRYCSMFSCQLPDVFKKNNEKEKKLFSLLNKAYINTRYKEDYSISYDELSQLTEKVKCIKELFEKHKP